MTTEALTTAIALAPALEAMPRHLRRDLAAAGFAAPWTRAADAGRFATSAPGFGSSDCHACASHLLVWRPGRTG